MSRHLSLALVVLALLAPACLSRSRRAQPPPADPTAVLRSAIVAAPPGAKAPAETGVFLVLRDSVDYARLATIMDQAGWTKAERRQRVPAFLARLAAASQTGLLRQALALKAKGELEEVEALRLVNWVAVKGRPRAVAALARRKEVVEVLPASYLRGRAFAAGLDAPGLRLRGAEPPPPPLPWAQAALHVEAARARGLNGRGVVVAIVDSGVAGGLPALSSGLRPGGWFDSVLDKPEPWDSNGHGTEILSLAVGRAEGIGVAPEAQWVAALANYGDRIEGIRLARSLDFVLAQRPDVLLLAFGGSASRCSEIWRPLLNPLLASEVFVIMAAGNEGPNLATDISPANLTHLYPGEGIGFAVGAVDSTLEVFELSGRGPRTCDPARPYPVVAAPGVAVRTLSRTGRETGVAGSSPATGLMAGVAALLIEARPDLKVADLMSLVTRTARDLRPSGVDPYSGYGLVDVERALATLDEMPRPSP